MTGALHYGYVKSVISGDSIVVMGGARPGQPIPEKVLVLSGIAAPRFARSKNSDNDEPFAYEAREYMRKLCIGKQVGFIPIAGIGSGREYANVYVGGVNVAQGLLAQGLATVKMPPSGARLSVEKEALLKFEEDAKAAFLGMHGKSAPNEHVRAVNWNPDSDKLYRVYAKKVIPAVVNQIRDGTTLRLEIAGTVNGESKTGRDVMIVTLSLAGARAPRVPISLEYRMNQHQRRVEEDPSYDKAAPEQEECPAFAKESLAFTEMRMLQRDVHVVILGMDMSKNLYGTVQFPRGNITTRLLEEGFAKYDPWSALLTGEKDLLLAASAAAKGKALRLAGLPVEEPPEEFQGKVVLVRSGDTITIRNGSNEKVSVSLSSIRAPRLGNPRRGEKDAHCAMDAREYLRKRLIGKKVRVMPEYTSTRDGRLYCTVIHGDVNVGVALVADGLADVIPHRQEEARSLHYGKLTEALRDAQRTGKGKFGAGGASAPLVDLTDRPRRPKAGSEEAAKSSRESAQGSRARQYLSFLQRERVCQGVVEYVFNGSRLKVMIPKENCMISLALVGIRTQRTEEEFGGQAREFIDNLCMQQTVRVEIETVDKGDNFIGSCWFGHTNLGVALLEQGLAQVVPRSAERSPYKDELVKAEAAAKEGKIGMWANYVEEVVTETQDGEEVVLKDQMQITITELADAVSFFYTENNSANATAVEAAMAEFNAAVPESTPETMAKGRILAGLYTDGCWYRVKNEGISGTQMRVLFVDYGNHDVLELANVRELPPAAEQLQPLARPAVLAGLKAPTKASEHFENAAICFHNSAFDRVLQAKVECVDKSNRAHLTLTDPAHPELSINSLLLRDGWCRLAEKPEWKLKTSVMPALAKDEEFAKQHRLNIWEYGDVSDEEEDENPRLFDGRTGKPLTR